MNEQSVNNLQRRLDEWLSQHPLIQMEDITKVFQMAKAVRPLRNRLEIHAGEYANRRPSSAVDYAGDYGLLDAPTRALPLDSSWRI
jgi:hypothetical protein